MRQSTPVQTNLQINIHIRLWIQSICLRSLNFGSQQHDISNLSFLKTKFLIIPKKLKKVSNSKMTAMKLYAAPDGMKTKKILVAAERQGLCVQVQFSKILHQKHTNFNLSEI